MDDNSCLPPTAQTPAKIEPGGTFDEMHKTILANVPGFVVFEDTHGLLHPIFLKTKIHKLACHHHVFIGEAINEAYLLLRRKLLFECSILELTKRKDADIL